VYSGNLVGAASDDAENPKKAAKKFPSGRENRRFGRRKLFKPAVFESDGGSRLPCVVVDISKGGARIQFRDGIAMPRVFVLFLEEEDLCIARQVVHRTANSCGVEFVGSPRRLSWLRRGANDGPEPDARDGELEE
jgi:hypothetical protein